MKGNPSFSSPLILPPWRLSEERRGEKGPFFPGCQEIYETQRSISILWPRREGPGPISFHGREERPSSSSSSSSSSILFAFRRPGEDWFSAIRALAMGWTGKEKVERSRWDYILPFLFFPRVLLSFFFREKLRDEKRSSSLFVFCRSFFFCSHLRMEIGKVPG